MIENPLISIITPVYNGAKYLPDLIESVLAQTYSHYEHIIIDDGSTDDGATVEVLKKYPHLRWWSRENKGQYATQNEGLEAAKGNIVCFIAADDIFYSQHIFQQVADYWMTHQNYDMVYGKTRRMDAGGRLLPDLEIHKSPSYWWIKHILYVQHCSLFVERDFLMTHGIRFDATYKHVGDWDWIIRLFQISQHIGYIRKPLSVIRMHPQQTSRVDSQERIATEHRRISENYGGSYRLHRFFSALINWRAMILLGWDTLRYQGIAAFVKRVKVWFHKKYQK